MLPDVISLVLRAQQEVNTQECKRQKVEAVCKSSTYHLGYLSLCDGF